MNVNMMEIKVPELGESIQEVQISHWLKQEGQWVENGEDIVEVESEKASQSLSAPSAGVLQKIFFQDGEFAKVGQVIAQLDPKGNPPAGKAKSETPKSASPKGKPNAKSDQTQVMPAAERSVHDNRVPISNVQPTGPGGRTLKEDVQRAIQRQPTGAPSSTSKAAPAPTGPGPTAPPSATTPKPPGPRGINAPAKLSETELANLSVVRQETVTPMSMIRRTIANRLVEAQSAAALLTTFNEIDMQPVMDLRKKYQEPFQAKHGVKLGFMSFFAKASVEGLKRFPAVNSEVRGTDIVSRNFYDLGVAIGGGKGLVVPVLRNVHRLSFAEIEREIGLFAQLAQDNKLKPADLEGGTFTISNGGVYGSLLSTPIVNPPQSGILGLHAIQPRPIALDGQVVIRPMMYIALTYDHRIVDGREAVGFLKTIKEVLEEPARLFLEV